MDRGIVLENAAEKLKRRKQPKSIIELPSHAEFRSLVKTLREAPLAVASGATAMVEFLAYSGMRVGEAREVRFEDVNLEAGSVLITGGELGTKNHQERVIPLFPNLRNLLVRLITAQDSTEVSERIFEIASLVARSRALPKCLSARGASAVRSSLAVISGPRTPTFRRSPRGRGGL